MAGICDTLLKMLGRSAIGKMLHVNSACPRCTSMLNNHPARPCCVNLLHEPMNMNRNIKLNINIKMKVNIKIKVNIKLKMNIKIK